MFFLIFFLSFDVCYLFVDFLADFFFTFFSVFFFFASNDKEGAGTEPEPERIMGPIHILKQYLTYFL